MNATKTMLIVLLATMATVTAMAGSGTVEGWFQAGSDIDGYAIGTEETDHGEVAFIKATDPAKDKFGTLMQTYSARDYLGKRIRMSASIKPVGVANWAGMWMRVDGGKKSTAFDNMQDRPLTGSSDWETYTVVLDVSEESYSISMGILLAGEGVVYWDDVRVEVVSRDVPVTSRFAIKSGPTNLDFGD